MTNAMNTRTSTRFFSLLLALILTVTSLVTIPTFGLAETNSKKVKIVNGGYTGISSSTSTFTIKGSAFSEKVVSIEVLSLARIAGTTAEKALDYIKNNAVFEITVSYKGKTLKTYTCKSGSGSFKLPKGSKKYTVTITSTLKNYKSTRLECINGAVNGQYRLKY